MKKVLLPVSFLFVFPLAIISQQLDHVLGEIIVQMRYGSDIQQVAKKITHLRGTPTNIYLKEELSPPLRIWLLEFDFTKVNENELLQKIRSIREVENAQFNHIGELRQTVPDDPAFEQQWMWLNTGQSSGLADADIDLDLAWDLTTGGQTADGQEIVVCVVEGTNRNHTDLQGNLWYNLAEIEDDGIDNDNNGYVDDYHGWHVNTQNDNIVDGTNGHGTFVSGAVGAKGNNGSLVCGVNWDIKIMHVDYSGTITEAKAVAAYTYPLVMRRKYNQTGGQEGAFVVATNSSWGIDIGNASEMPIWCAMYDSLGLEGVLSCGSTTNDDVNVDLVGDLPTGCTSEYLISVTATDDFDMRNFSGYGVESVDVAAPGEGFVSLGLNGGPSIKSGTSFASPTVAGIVGLLYAAPCATLGAQALGAPAATAEFVRDAIFQGVDVVPNLIGEVKYGGRVNAFNSMEILLANCGPCPKPFGIQITHFTDVEATLEWFSTDSTLRTDLLFRKVGDPEWDDITDISSPYHFEGLEACTQYELQLQDICANEISGYSNTFIFETDGCCVPPSNLQIINLNEDRAAVTWESIFAAESYNLLLTTPSGSELFENLTVTAFDFYNLDTCTAYSIQLQTVCDTGTTDFSPPIYFETIGCGNCTDLPYCPSKSIDATGEWIANVSLNNLNNTSASNDGYGEFTNLSVDLTTYQSFPINLSPGYDGFPYNEWFKVFIDFNQDGDFNDSDEEVFDAGGSSNQSVQGEIFVPGDAVPGSTRMRVVMKFNSEPTACETNISFGEVEDYCVNVMEGTPAGCQYPAVFNAFNIEQESAEFYWTSLNDASMYEVQIRPTNSANWAVIVAQDTTFLATNLGECTDYECRVRSVCLSTKSDWSPSAFFKTECIIDNVDRLPIDIGFLNVSPNPFNDNLSIQFELITLSTIDVELIDINGRIIVKKENRFGVGKQRVNLFLDENLLHSGVYFLKIATERGFVIRKVVKY